MKKLLILLFSLVSFWVNSQNLPNYWVPTSGTDTYTTGIPNFGSSNSNRIAFVKFTNTNTGAATININSLGAKALKKWDGSAWVDLAAGDLKTTVVYGLAYDGTNFNVTGANLGDGGGSGGVEIAQVMDSIDNAIDTLMVDPGGASEDDVLSYASGAPVWIPQAWWNLSGTSTLTGNVTILGAGTRSISFGSWDENNVIANFQVYAGWNELIAEPIAQFFISPTEFYSSNPGGGISITDGYGIGIFARSGQPFSIELGIGSNTTGDIYQRDASGYLSQLAAVATGNVLISGGVGAVNSWGKVGLSTHVSGTLPVASGGTGVTSSTGSGSVVLSTSPTLTTPALGTPSALTLTNATGLPPTTGIAGWPANASGVLTNNGSGTLSWGAGGGITNGGSADEIVKSNGTNLIGTGLFTTSLGDFSLGGGSTSGTTRIISVAGSSANINMTISSKAASYINFTNSTAENYLQFAVGNGNSYGFTGFKSSANDSPLKYFAGDGVSGSEDGQDVIIKAGDGYVTSGDGDGGDLILRPGVKRSAGTGTTGGAYTYHSGGELFPIDGRVKSVIESGTSFTLTEEHRGAFVYCTNSSAITVTVPTGLVDDYATTIVQMGTGVPTLSASGTTIVGALSPSDQYKPLPVHQWSTNNFIGY